MERSFSFWVVILHFVILSWICASEDVNIGGIFDVDEEHHEVFRHAVKIHRRALGTSKLHDISSRALLNNEFQVSKSVCSVLNSGVFAIFGPNSKASPYVQSICDTMEIPHIETSWHHKYKRQSCKINLHPHPDVLGRLFLELIKLFNWKSVTIIYENNESLLKLGELLTLTETDQYHITFRQLDVNMTGNYRPALTEVKKSGEKFYLLDCSIKILPEVLKQALQVGLMSDSHNYIITNLDLHTLDLFPYRHGGANITGVQLVDPTNNDVIDVARSFERMKMHKRPEYTEVLYPERYLRVESALMYDAVKLFVEGLKQLRVSKVVHSKPLYCNESYSWEHGYSLINYMRTNTITGLTGIVKFDYQGYRTDFALNLIELSPTGLQNFGTWNSTDGFTLTREYPAVSNQTNNGESLHNKTFLVLIALSEPYQMLKEAPETLWGNDRYEGFGIDLIHELSVMLGFRYIFKVQEDGQYGSKNLKTGEWNGMVRELQENRADLAITDLTITSERESAVDFTHPFMNLGISILYKKPTKVPPHLFSFMSPFSKKVWYSLGGAYIGVSLLTYLIARLAPAEWTNRYPCIDEPEYLENQFSFKNCFWFTVGSLMSQGSEIAPVAISTRVVAGTWGFFILIMGQTYTANLAAFLAVESQISPFKTIEELADQNVIKYGAKEDGATANFFMTSTYATYQKIWEFMKANPDVMTKSNPEGVKRADNEDYAFFMESTTIEYMTQRFCNLTQVGRLLDDKGYGIAMKKNSTYRHILSTAVLKLQERGRLHELKRKWWKEKRGGGKCSTQEGGTSVMELGVANLGGVFYVLVVGVIAGIFVGFVEWLWHVLKLSYKHNTSYREEFQKELKFLWKLKERTKPVAYSKSRSSSKHSLEGLPYSQEPRYAYDITANPTKNNL